jgi:ABC-type branched-subunit amino acid transport system substrate-binding protein
MRATPLLLALLLFTLPAGARAQIPPWTVGVVVSSSGTYADVGRPQAFAAERTAAALAVRGIFGIPLLVEVRDDGGDPRRAEALANELAEAGAVAVLCCTTPAATARVAEALHARMTPHLALAEADLGGRFWSFALVPDDRARLTAIAVDAALLGKASLALMTLDTPFGSASEAALERALADTGRSLAGEARYPAFADVLTPEALWVATREPGAVIVWGLPRDLPVALDALRRRGYAGPVYARAAALPPTAMGRLVPAGPPTIDGGDTLVGVRTAVAPAVLAGRLPDDHPHAQAVGAFVGRVLGGDPYAASAAEREVMARVDDALVWLVAAFEQVAALGLDDGPLTRRLATRDALVGAPLARLAAGAYDAKENDPRTAGWLGLTVAKVR